jgi:hypothetical protein
MQNDKELKLVVNPKTFWTILNFWLFLLFYTQHKLPYIHYLMFFTRYFNVFKIFKRNIYKTNWLSRSQNRRETHLTVIIKVNTARQGFIFRWEVWTLVSQC